MSMYNVLFGENPLSDILLDFLGLKRSDFYRYRDSYLSDDGREIVVYTRGGGGNRESNDTDVEGHPCFLRDEDDDFDCTYASYFFRIPEAAKDVIDMLQDIQGPKADPAVKWASLLDSLSKKEQTNEVKRAKAVTEKIIGAIQAVLDKEE